MTGEPDNPNFLAMKKTFVLFLLLCTLTSASFAGAPVRVRILPGTTAATEAVVFWELPPDYAAVKHYVVRVDGRRAGTTDHNNLRITGLEPATTYRVRVAAVDAAGREAVSEAIELRTRPAPRIFDVRDYGARGDGVTLDTKAIQQAIDACTPGGEVYVPAGDYLTGALFICKSDISLHLSEGATLRAVNNLGHFPMVENIYEGWVKPVFASVLNIGRLYGDRYRNIRVYGGGTIDNQGSLLADQQTRTVGRMARSHGLPVIRCDEVAIDDVTVTNPCTWNVHPLLCDGFTTYACRLVSSGFGLSNADGWDPDSSSECYLLESVLDGQDDNVAVKSVVYPTPSGEKVLKPAENIFVSHCHFVQGGGLVVGAEVPAGVRNVWFTDCVVERCDRGFHVCSRPLGTRPVEGIHFRDIEVKRSGCWGINVTVWYWVPSYLPGAYGPDELLPVRDVSFENIRIRRTDGNPIQVLGVAEQPIRNIALRNVTIDQSQYDVLLRNVHGVRFENVQVGERYWLLDGAEGVERDALTSAPRKMDYPHELVDPDATYRTKALYDNLHKVARSGRFLFGAQDATASGFGWCDDSGRSDIERISGRKPAFYSWDFMDIVDARGRLKPEAEKVRRLTCQAFYEGGVISYCWHAPNPVTGGSFYDTSERVVERILPGGSHHAVFTAMLDRIAAYSRTLVGKNGEQIPVIFRPWHECDGDWFWWGRAGCSPEELKQLYRFTVSYLRDRCGVHNFLYCFSPDINFTSTEEYLRYYPGNDCVDVVAMDDYWLYRFEEKNLDHAHRRLKVISDYAQSAGKIAALSETGQGAIDDPRWFTERLLASIYGYPDEPVSLAYVAVWRNSTQGFFTPYAGHPATADFLRFLDDERVVTASPYDWLGMYYHLTD